MASNKEPVAIRFGDLPVGTSIVSPTERMLQVDGLSRHLDETGQQLMNIVMGRALERVSRDKVVIDSNSLSERDRRRPKPEQIRLLMQQLLTGAVSPFAERHGRDI